MRSLSQTWDAASPGSTEAPQSGHGSERDWGNEANGINHYRQISARLHPSIEGTVLGEGSARRGVEGR